MKAVSSGTPSKSPHRRVGKIGLSDIWMFPVASGIGVNFDLKEESQGLRTAKRAGEHGEHQRDLSPGCLCMHV